MSHWQFYVTIAWRWIILWQKSPDWTPSFNTSTSAIGYANVYTKWKTSQSNGFLRQKCPQTALQSHCNLAFTEIFFVRLDWRTWSRLDIWLVLEMLSWTLNWNSNLCLWLYPYYPWNARVGLVSRLTYLHMLHYFAKKKESSRNQLGLHHRILGDRPNGKLWLRQDSYVDKITNRFMITILGYEDSALTFPKWCRFCSCWCHWRLYQFPYCI